MRRLIGLIVFFLSCLLTVPASGHVLAQGEVTGSGQFRATGVETSEFPAVHVTLLATDAEGRRVTNLDRLILRENGRPVSGWTAQDVPAGVDVVFVIDANSSIGTQDEEDGPARLEKVQDSIVRFATQYMRADGLDRASIVVPEAGSPRFLLRSSSEPLEIVDAAEAYRPSELGETPLQAMLMAALEELGSQEREGYRAVVLYTDGADLDRQLRFRELVAEADRLGVAFLPVILGARADQNEIENVTQLYAPTGGSFEHMRSAPDADPLLEQLAENGFQTRITYESDLRESGAYPLQLTLDGRQLEAELNLDLDLPELLLELPATIERAGTRPDATVSSLQPSVQPLSVQIRWPENQAVALRDVVILVNGNAHTPETAPVIDTTGQLRFDWDISMLDAGTYALAVEVVDALGRTSRTEPASVTIRVIRPEPPTAVPSVAEATAEPAGLTIPTQLLVAREDQPRFVAILGGLSFAIVGALLVLRRRRRRPVKREKDYALQQDLQAPDAEGVTAQGPVFLLLDEPDANGSTAIPLTEPDVAVGRDPRLVQIPLADASVSRLHARLRLLEGRYWLYDEGSASGTYLNFTRIGLAPQLLSPGDEIHVGRVHMRFQAGLPPQPVSPATVADVSGADEAE